MAARAALAHEPVDAIAARLGVSVDTVLQMLRFPTAAYLAAMTVVSEEDSFGVVYDLKRLDAYRIMLDVLPDAWDSSPRAIRPASSRRGNQGRLEFRLTYLLIRFAGQTRSRAEVESILAGMTDGASAEECRHAVARFIDKGKLRPEGHQGTDVYFPRSPIDLSESS